MEYEFAFIILSVIMRGSCVHEKGEMTQLAGESCQWEVEGGE
jgi:hypothetical protein